MYLITDLSKMPLQHKCIYFHEYFSLPETYIPTYQLCN